MRGAISGAAVELDAYRREADRFLAALDGEYYLHYAGLKDTFDLAPIYERFADLTTLDSCERLASAAAEQDGGARELRRFACEGYLGSLTRAEEEEIANLEASTAAEVQGESIGYRMIKPELANEPDRGRRELLERAREEIARETLEPIYRRALETLHEGARRLGAPSYRALYGQFGLDLDGLAADCSRLLDETDGLFEPLLDPLLERRLGFGLAEAKRWDIPRFFRASEWDPAFPAGTMLAALEATLGELGIDLRRQKNVELDLEPRPNKTPRAFCAPVEVPERVVLVIRPIGGPDDWFALFHEAGHTEHFAHTSPALPVEWRRLGDNAVTEGWAALLELLVSEPAWLRRRLDFGRPEEFAAESAANHLWVLRRYCAKLLYELELHQTDDLDAMRDRYTAWMTRATRIEPAATDFLADVDQGFYASSYLRSWAFEAQIREHLRNRFGTTWFTRREAGSLLRELWYEGQSMSAEQLVREVTGAELDMGRVVERIREDLTA